MRYADDIIRAVREHQYLSPVEKQVLITRIGKEPTKEELLRAHAVVYGGDKVNER